ncbi:PEGA domain-containing protein [Bradymonas sediminis]|nr:PEGA domain-containing protein [Bradymonas sediminis]
MLMIALAALPLAPQTAQAQASISAEDLARFKLRVSDGKRLFEMGKYRASIEQFEAARDIYDHSRLLFNIAQSYKAMNACAQARAMFDRYLAVPDIDPKMRQHATSLREELADSCVEEGTLQVHCTPKNATLTLTQLTPDGAREAAQPASCPLDSKLRVGRYELRAQAPGFVPSAQQIEVRRDETQSLRLTLEAEPRLLDPELEEVLIYSTIGVGAATVVAGFISDYTAVSRLDELHQAQRAQDARAVAELRDQADTASTRSAILYGVGGVILAGGVTWKIIQMSANSEGDTRAHARQTGADSAKAGAQFSVDIGLNNISTRLDW